MSSTLTSAHEGLRETFRGILARGRLAHAYLFVGPEGVGKRAFALELTKALLCEAAGAAAALVPCGHCPSCLQVEARTHPDFQLEAPPEDAHEFPVAQLKELIGRLAYKPSRGSHRITVVEHADIFSTEAANCFLKTLEEPPPHSLLILLGTSPDRQLPTIQSRCQVIHFRPLSVDQIAGKLLQEGVVTEKGAAERLAQVADGSVTTALMLADPDVMTMRTNLLGMLARPRIDSLALGQLLTQFAEQDVKESAEKRRRAALAIKFIVDFLAGCQQRQQGLAPKSMDPSVAALQAQIAQRVGTDRLQDALARCLDADYQNERRLQLLLIMEALADGLAKQLTG